MPVPFEASQLAKDDEPPPRLIAVLLDRPQLTTAAGLSLETMPRLACQLWLFGRQTDRAARLEGIEVSADGLASIRAVVREIGGAAIAEEPSTTVVGHISATRRKLLRAWQPPRETSREQIESLAREHQRAVLLDIWPETPLPCLGGKSPRARRWPNPSNASAMSAALCLLDYWQTDRGVAADLDELRRRLGLPILEPIEVADEKALDSVPLNRLARLVLEKLSDKGLLAVFRRAMMYNVREALRRFAAEIIARPSLAEHPDRFRAHRILSQTAENFDEALQHLEQGRKAAELAGQSCAEWDLMEFPLRLARGEGRDAQRLMRQHSRAPHAGTGDRRRFDADPDPGRGAAP